MTDELDRAMREAMERVRVPERLERKIRLSVGRRRRLRYAALAAAALIVVLIGLLRPAPEPAVDFVVSLTEDPPAAIELRPVQFTVEIGRDMTIRFEGEKRHD